jgi:polysaccharide biosynthesis protein PelD
MPEPEDGNQSRPDQLTPADTVSQKQGASPDAGEQPESSEGAIVPRRRFRLLSMGSDTGGARWTCLPETLLFLGVILAVNALLHPQDPGYLSVQPHPFWIVVVLISIRYAFEQSIVCASIVAAAYSCFVLLADGYRFSALSLFSDFRDPLLFLLVSGFLSGYTQHLLERTEVLRTQLRQRDQELGELRDQTTAARQALHQLEGRISGEFTSILDLFAELAATRQMSPAEIKRSLLDVLYRYLKVQQARYYDVERGELHPVLALAESRAIEELDAPPFLPDGQCDFILAGALNGDPDIHPGQFSQRHDLEQYGGSSLLARALCTDTDVPFGLVSVERIEFVDYNPHTFKLFKTVIDWWSRVLNEALRLEELRAQSIFDQDLGLFNYHYFASRIGQEFERTRRFALPMSIALFRIADSDQINPEQMRSLKTTLAHVINQGITELEMAALYRRDDTLAVSFPIAMVEDAEKRVRQIHEEITRYDFHPYRDADRSLRLDWAIADYEIGMESHEAMVERVEQNLDSLRA